MMRRIRKGVRNDKIENLTFAMDGFREPKTNRNDVEEKKIILKGLFS
jgi:hypothetical protein